MINKFAILKKSSDTLSKKSPWYLRLNIYDVKGEQNKTSQKFL